MYKIIDTDNGKIIGYTNKVLYIRLKTETGSYVSCKYEAAEGVVFNSVPYNLSGHTMKEELKTVAVSEDDDGAVIVQIVADSEGRTGDVLCEVDTSIEEIKDALCEIDEQLNGGGGNE
jgi:hypothetical protein